MADIYEQHRAAFARVSAFVILDAAGKAVATVAIKFPRDGAGRLYAYCHIIGVEMQRDHAGGYGYDKRSPAVRGAFAKAPEYVPHPQESMAEYGRDVNETRRRINAALAMSDGEYWDRLLEKAGFIVMQAI